MLYNFEYAKVADRFFPIIPLLVGKGDEWVPIDALVDSGAVISLFTADVGRALGLKVEDGEPFKPTGISGNLTAYLHSIKLKVGEIDIQTRAAFTDQLALKINLLGREGLFEHFQVVFNEKRKQLTLNED